MSFSSDQGRYLTPPTFHLVTPDHSMLLGVLYAAHAAPPSAALAILLLCAALLLPFGAQSPPPPQPPSVGLLLQSLWRGSDIHSLERLGRLLTGNEHHETETN